MKNTNKMISKTEFYNLYNRNSKYNKNREVGDWANKLYRRDIGFYIAYYFAKFGISANLVTALNLITSVIFIILFINPSLITLVILFFAFELSYILDNVDGQLARYNGTFSNYGDLFDIFTDIFVASFFAMAFGIRLFTSSHNNAFLILGSLGAMAFVFEGLWVKNSNEILGSYTSENSKLTIYKLRTYLLSIENIGLISLIIFILTILQNLFGSINLVEIFFLFYILVLFTTKIILRYILLFRKANSVERTVWKGWEN